MKPASPSITDTEFSTAGRAAAKELEQQRKRLLDNGAVAPVLEAIPAPIFLLNGQRQVVHANQRALKIFGILALQDILGLRLGEILGCSHTVGQLEGCGGAGACGNCGALQSIFAAMGGKSAKTECQLELNRGGQSMKARFVVRTAAVPLQGLPLVMLILTPKSVTPPGTKVPAVPAAAPAPKAAAKSAPVKAPAKAAQKPAKPARR